jgi:hypothetical protein
VRGVDLRAPDVRGEADHPQEPGVPALHRVAQLLLRELALVAVQQLDGLRRYERQRLRRALLEAGDPLRLRDLGRSREGGLTRRFQWRVSTSPNSACSSAAVQRTIWNPWSRKFALTVLLLSERKALRIEEFTTKGQPSRQNAAPSSGSASGCTWQ